MAILRKTVITGLFLGFIFAPSIASAQYFRRACNSCCIRSNAKYETTVGNQAVRVLGKSTNEIETSLPTDLNGKTLRLDKVSIKKKNFHFSKNSATVNKTSLEEIAAILFEDGLLTFSARLKHQRQSVSPLTRITLLAYSAADQNSETLVDAPLVFKKSFLLTPKPGMDRPITFSTENASEKARVKRLFREITHLEIEINQ